MPTAIRWGFLIVNCDEGEDGVEGDGIILVESGIQVHLRAYDPPSLFHRDSKGATVMRSARKRR